MRCADCQEIMVEALYEELVREERERFDAHVGQCDDCRATLEEMRGTLGWMDKRERRDPGAAYWDGYWNRLTARMEKEGVALGRPAPWWRRNVFGAGPKAAWAYRAVAAAAILVLGVFVGRTFFPEVQTNPPTVATTSGEEESHAAQPLEKAPPAGMAVQPASANERAMRYIGKSQLLLIALVNHDPTDAYGADFNAQRARSAELVDEAPAIKASLTGPKQRRLRELVGELEKILVQIANLESDEDVEGVEFIRSRVNDHDVLFKIDLEQMRQGDEGGGDSDRTNTRRSI
jgi:hypothetical protein